MNCVMDEDTGYNFKIMRNKREDKSLHLACSKKFYLLPYSNHLRKRWELELVMPL